MCKSVHFKELQKGLATFLQFFENVHFLSRTRDMQFNHVHHFCTTSYAVYSAQSRILQITILHSRCRFSGTNICLVLYYSSSTNRSDSPQIFSSPVFYDTWREEGRVVYLHSSLATDSLVQTFDQVSVTRHPHKFFSNIPYT